MTLTGEVDGDPGDLPGIYSDSIGQFRDILIELSEVRNSEYELLAEYSRHAGAVATILNADCDFFEDSRPADPTDIRKYMTREMNALWKLREILVEDLSLYDAESFQVAISECTEQVRAVICNELNSIRRIIKQTLADSIRAAWDDLSDTKASSKRRIKSRAAALQRLRDVAQGWLTLSEELNSVANLSSHEDDYPNITGT
jgi:hypothetical protein